MNRYTKKEVQTLLDESIVGIENSLRSPPVMARVLEFNYDAKNFRRAKKLHKKAEKFFIGSGLKTGKKVSLSIRLNGWIGEIHLRFMLYEKLIRRDLRDDPALFMQFGLESSRDYTVSGKIMEPKGFYRNILENERLSEYVVKFGLTEEKLNIHLGEIDKVEVDENYRAVLKSIAEKANQDKHRVYQQLNDWWIGYKMVLVYLYRDDPQQLEAFKITAYSEGYKPKRKKKVKGKGDESETPGPGDTGDSQ
ncbi:MAG: hypothetical protein GY940_05615 [bacterium]|nr:hypothetical protein [bacterium]